MAENVLLTQRLQGTKMTYTAKTICVPIWVVEDQNGNVRHIIGEAPQGDDVKSKNKQYQNQSLAHDIAARLTNMGAD
jgi:hypothetical protein